MLRRPAFFAGSHPPLFNTGSLEDVIRRFLHLLARDELALRAEARASDTQTNTVSTLGYGLIALDLVQKKI
jgi:hypothetical protein